MTSNIRFKGVWGFRYQLQRCGESKFYNAIFTDSGNGDAFATPRAYYPGTTNAGPVLVKDAMRAVLSVALTATTLKACRDIDVFDMRVTEPSHDVVAGEKMLKGVWTEAWTFRLCGQMIDVDVSFIADSSGGGTRFVVHPEKPGEATKNRASAHRLCPTLRSTRMLRDEPRRPPKLPHLWPPQTPPP